MAGFRVRRWTGLAMQLLLADITAGRVDTVAVYKVY
jgi:hypothetical protein